jgi:hypothetical protein
MSFDEQASQNMNKGKPWPLDQLSIIEGCNDGFIVHALES